MPERADKTEAYRLLRAQESKIIDRCRVTDGGKFRLKDHDPADTAGHQSDKPVARALLEGGVQRLSEQQEKLYAQDRWAMLCCFQAMDAAGKDSTIKHVMSGVNPQGVQVTSFKAPGPEELGSRLPVAHRPRAARARAYRHLQPQPLRGSAGGARAPALLERQRLPPSLIGKRIWAERLEAIAGFERHLAREGWVIQKFFLHLSRRSRSAASSPGSTNPRRTGSSAPPTSPSAASGTTTWRPTRRRSPPPRTPCAVVRGPRRQQVVHPPRRGRRDQPGAGPARL